jgi:protein TonB
MSGSSLTGAPALSPGQQAREGYQLSDELARLCLPAEYEDNCRTLGWVNSICFLFLLIGLLGLKAPRVVRKPLSEVTELVPVVFTPPVEQQKVEPQVKEEEPAPKDTPIETPQVVTVVAAADAPNVAFAVPVEGAVAVAPARYASPPPVAAQAPKPTKFDPNAANGGNFPPPDYPGMAQRNRYQGTVTVELMVDETGAVTSAKVQKSSGFPMLDEAALKVVKSRWRFPPGAPRDYIWDCKFQLQ